MEISQAGEVVSSIYRKATVNCFLPSSVTEQSPSSTQGWILSYSP